jgi:hypothetical protein
MTKNSQSLTPFESRIHAIVDECLSSISTISSCFEEVLTIIQFSFSSIENLAIELEVNKHQYSIPEQKLNQLSEIIKVPVSELDQMLSQLRVLQEQIEWLIAFSDDLNCRFNSRSSKQEALQLSSETINKLSVLKEQGKKVNLQLLNRFQKLGEIVSSFEQCIMSCVNNKCSHIANKPTDVLYEAQLITYSQINNDLTRVLQFIDINNQLITYSANTLQGFNQAIKLRLQKSELSILDHFTGSLNELVNYQPPSHNPVTTEKGKDDDFELF